MIEYLLILSEHEGIAIRAAHLPRPGDMLDVLKDYGSRERLRFLVSTVTFDITVADVPTDGVRGTCETLPFVQGKIVERKIDGVWTLTPNIEAKCPFCDGRIAFQTEGMLPHAEHTVPSCKTFDDAEDALAFIVLVNNKLGVKRS